VRCRTPPAKAAERRPCERTPPPGDQPSGSRARPTSASPGGLRRVDRKPSNDGIVWKKWPSDVDRSKSASPKEGRRPQTPARSRVSCCTPRGSRLGSAQVLAQLERSNEQALKPKGKTAALQASIPTQDAQTQTMARAQSQQPDCSKDPARRTWKLSPTPKASALKPSLVPKSKPQVPPQAAGRPRASSVRARSQGSSDGGIPLHHHLKEQESFHGERVFLARVVQSGRFSSDTGDFDLRALESGAVERVCKARFPRKRPKSAPPGGGSDGGAARGPVTRTTPCETQLRNLDDVPHFNAWLAAESVHRILAVGDCHGGRTLCRLSSNVLSCFHGGSIYTWVTGKREIPALARLVGSVQRGTYVVVFSYGEIDCRCHASKFKDHVEMLSMPYAATIRAYVDAFGAASHGVRVFPIVLAVPPATDQGYNPNAPFRGTLPSRVTTTQLLNASLETACLKHGVLFTGTDTWDFATGKDGALLRELSDGHVHIKPNLCGPVVRRVRQLISKAINGTAAVET